MKIYFKYTLIILAIIFSCSKTAFAQNADENSIKTALTSLLDYSKSKAFEKAATLIAYDGEDKNRLEKDSFNATNKEELNQAKRICKKISALIELSSKYEFGEFSVSNSSGKNIYSIQVDFISGNQKLVTTFNFIKSGNKYLLNNMN
jgi:hypothetical protein